MAHAQANQQGSQNLPQVPTTVPGCFVAAWPVQAGTGNSLEIVSEGLTWDQLVKQLMAWAASLSAQVEHW